MFSPLSAFRADWLITSKFDVFIMKYCVALECSPKTGSVLIRCQQTMFGVFF